MFVASSVDRVEKEHATVDVHAAKPTPTSVKCRLGQRRKSTEPGIVITLCVFYWQLFALLNNSLSLMHVNFTHGMLSVTGTYVLGIYFTSSSFGTSFSYKARALYHERQNRWRCRLGCGLGWAQGIVLDGVQIPLEKGQFLGKGSPIDFFCELCRNGWTDRFGCLSCWLG